MRRDENNIWMANLGLSSYLFQSRWRVAPMLALRACWDPLGKLLRKPCSTGVSACARIEHRVQKWVIGPHRETLTFSTCECLPALLCSLFYLLCVGQVSFVWWFWQVAHGVREVHHLGVHGLILPLCPTAGDICSLEGIPVAATKNKLAPDLPQN